MHKYLKYKKVFFRKLIADKYIKEQGSDLRLFLMYWDIGKSIFEQQEESGWGVKVIDRMSHDLKEAFPGMICFSPRNLKWKYTHGENLMFQSKKPDDVYETGFNGNKNFSEVTYA